MSEAVKFIRHVGDSEARLAGAVAAAAAGILSHLFYFIRGEHNSYAHRWIIRGLAGITLLAGGMLHLEGYRVRPAAITTALLTSLYFTGLFGSISLYRLCFHPLNKFPGPFWARLSNLYHLYAIRKSDNYLLMQKLHKEHGPIVRTGPNNLSINDPNAVRPVLSNSAKCIKGAWYERSLPLVSLQTVRDKKKHDTRRKVFSKAFAPPVQREYDRRLVVHCEEFVRQIKAIGCKPFNATNWFKYLAFDVMGDVGLGKEFRMLTSKKNRWIPDLLEISFADVGPTMPVPWLGPIMMRLPKAGVHSRAWLEFVGSQVRERVEKHVDKADVLSHLVEAYSKSSKEDIDYQWLRGDTRLTIVGGSDTTAATLTYIFYHLAKDPSQVKKLREELEPLLDGQNTLAREDVAKAQHLDGIVQEALRLHPPIPSGFPRITPPEGIMVGDTFVPGNTTVVLPVYTMQRDEINYARAEEFIPERWYSKPELIKHREVFLTWNIGLNGCIGKALAISEMKSLITHFIQNFEGVRFAPGEDGAALLNETLDHFTVGLKPLRLIFEEKK